MTTAVRDITEADFDTVVIQGSKTRPVVVDFWAPWCGPCRHLSPLLERVAERYAGDVEVVKLNVDDAPVISRRFRVQGIPAVKAFKDGTVAGEFVGVQPEAVIDQLFAGVAPTQSDRLVEQALAETDADQAETLLRQALEHHRDHPRGVVALAQIAAERGDVGEATRLLARIPSDPQGRRLLAQLRLATPDQEDLNALRDAADAGDTAAAVELGRILAARSSYAEALGYLMAAVRDPQVRDDARSIILTVFEVVGADSELVRQWRPRLAAALF